METLQRHLRRLAERKDARWWTGERPDVRDGQLARVIAGEIDLPSADNHAFNSGGLVRVDRANAARILAIAGTVSLAYQSWLPRAQALTEAKNALDDLAENATYFSNGDWAEGASSSWSPLTHATFDCGIIGFDDERAFIFWVEEED